MPRDDLLKPLHKRSLMQRLWAQRPSGLLLAYVVVTTGLIGGSTWLMHQPLPFAGEPIVLSALPPVEAEETASIAPVSENPVVGVEAVEDPAPKSTKSVPEIAGSFDAEPQTREPQIIVSTRQALARAPIAALTEAGPDGPLPRIGQNGKKPADAYARTVPLGLIHSDAPKIVIILGGMGLNEKLTAKATRDLNGAITFAFAPYGNTLQSQVDAARNQGHEVFLQLPLEPVGYPASDPGPRTLLADADANANVNSLVWHMSRFSGYAGVVNYMGGRFLAAPNAVKPVLNELRKRGMVFLEDGSLQLSATDEVAKLVQLPVRHGDITIDENPDPASITDALGRLEDKARKQGMAIGTGSGLGVTIDTVKDWVKAAEERGIVIVPASAAFKNRAGL